MASTCSVCFFSFLWLSVIFAQVDEPHKRFEYKFSFKGPFLAQKDGKVPFWEHGGHAIASDDQVRITPSIRSQKGHMWSTFEYDQENWEAEVTFRINGRGRVGADGLAIWFTDRKGVEGPVYGSNDKWVGLGVFLDSFDNDGQHNNPYILAMVNDGTKNYDHRSDGLSQQIGGCLRDFRNKPFPTKLKITYYQNTLIVLYEGGMTNTGDNYEMCFRADNVVLPKRGHFGVSAATGGLADDHDVLAFLTYTLTPPQAGLDEQGFATEEERRKYREEFEENLRQLERQKEEYRKQHPDQFTQDGQWTDEMFEGLENRQMRQIFDGQAQIHEIIRRLHQKMDAVLGRQENVMSMVSGLVSAAQQGGGIPQVQPGQGQQGQGQGQIYMDTIKRHEIDALMQSQRDVQVTISDLKNLFGSMQQQFQRGGGGASAGSGASFDASHVQLLNEVRDGVNIVKRDVSAISSRGGSNCPPAPPVPKCLTPMYFYIAITIQIFLIIGYMMYKSSQENRAKKFF